MTDAVVYTNLLLGVVMKVRYLFGKHFNSVTDRREEGQTDGWADRHDKFFYASTHLYKRLFPSLRWSVGTWVRRAFPKHRRNGFLRTIRAPIDSHTIIHSFRAQQRGGHPIKIWGPGPQGGLRFRALGGKIALGKKGP